MAEYSPRREQVESYSDKCDDESLCLDEIFQDDWDAHTPPKQKVKSYCENICEDDEPLFLDILFKDNAIIVVRKRVLRLEFPLKEGRVI